ncbi:VOC family protein [Streptomyces sp. NPDC000987]|uniref:VOC family protein n=1 Tax=Streptomyces sp. NPDC000987 TaxID=3154374 RepID=UPI003332A3F8
MLTAVDHVQLAAPPGSEDRLRAYYAGVLGMTEIPKPPVLAARGGCWFRAGRVRLHFGVEEDFRPGRKAHPGLRVTDIENCAARLEAGGAPVQWDEDPPGHRRFYSEDPVGNRLEFLEPGRRDTDRGLPAAAPVTRRADNTVGCDGE